MLKRVGWLFTLIAFIGAMIFPLNAVKAANEEQLMFMTGTRQIYQNGSVYLAKAPHTVKNGVTYVSMRSLAERLGFSITYNAATKEYVMQKGEHQLAFKLSGKTYRYNGDVRTIRSGEIYTENGTMMIPLRETVTPLGMNISVSGNRIYVTWKQAAPKPVVPLQVKIDLPKTTYQIGEDIRYREIITGGSGQIVSKTWTNNEPAFFTPGPKRITLEVRDANGMVSRDEIIITITDEVYRTKEQYEALKTPIGDKISIDGDKVLTYKTIEYETIEKDYTLIRSNSPERINVEGIYYEDTLRGPARILIHKQNERDNPVNVYLVARNVSDRDATVELRHLGVGGPNKYVATNAKTALSNYYQSLKSGKRETMTLKPKEVAVIAKDEISKPILPSYTLTAYADVYSDQDVLYQVIVLDESTDFERVYPYLRGVAASRDNRHTRGTFPKGNRTLNIAERIGDEPSRLVIGDGQHDTYVNGYDALSGGMPETNYGNRGVYYTMTLERVAPHTALVLNPRGGQYIGAFVVNGQTVITPNAGTIAAKHEAAVLYRTGSREEKVTIEFIPASGSNLPLNIVAIPLVP